MRGRAPLATAALALVLSCSDGAPARRAGPDCPVRTPARTCETRLSGWAATTWRGDSGRTGTVAGDVTERPRRTAFPARSPAAAAGVAGEVHLTAHVGQLVAASAAGGPGWRFTLGEDVSPVTVVRDLVFVGGRPSSFGGEPPKPGRLHALATATGQPVWHVETDGAPTAPAVAADLVHTVTRNGEVLAVTFGGQVRWRVHLGVPVEAPAAVAGGVVAVVTAAGDTVVLAAADGTRRWERAGPAGGGSVVVDGDSVYVLSGGAVRAYDLADGRTRWSARAGAPGLPLTVDRAHVYAAAGAGLVAITRRTGVVHWRNGPHPCRRGPFLDACALDPVDALAAPPVVVGRTVVAWYAVTGVVAYDAGTGGLRWRVPAAVDPGLAVLLPTARGLYAGGGSPAVLLG